METVRELLAELGLNEPIAPGQMKMKKHVTSNPSTSYTLVYDWKSDPDHIRIELRAGLTGEKPAKKELAKYALWLQSENYLDIAVSQKPTKH